MLVALALLAGVLLLTMVFNNRRRPSQSDGGSVGDVSPSPWAYSGDSVGDSGGDCGKDEGGGGCDGGGGGGGD